MGALLSPKVWVAVAIAIALAGSHWKAYVMGEATVQAGLVPPPGTA